MADGGLRLPGPERVESWPDGDWVVRPVAGARATRAYRCPGCGHEVAQGTPHLVTWPVGALDDRRHWHTPCWRTRERRRPSRRGRY